MSGDIFSGKTVVCSLLHRGFSVNLPQHSFQRILAIRCVLGTLTSAQSRLQMFTFSLKEKERAFLGPFFQDEKGHALYSSFARTSLIIRQRNPVQKFYCKIPIHMALWKTK